MKLTYFEQLDKLEIEFSEAMSVEQQQFGTMMAYLRDDGFPVRIVLDAASTYTANPYDAKFIELTRITVGQLPDRDTQVVITYDREADASHIFLNGKRGHGDFLNAWLVLHTDQQGLPVEVELLHLSEFVDDLTLLKFAVVSPSP